MPSRIHIKVFLNTFFGIEKLSDRVFSNLIVLIASRLATIVVSILSIAILARFVSPEGFGYLASTTITLGLANALFDGAFGIGLVRRVNVDRSHISSTLGAAIALALLIVGLLNVFAPTIEGFYRFAGLGKVIQFSSALVVFKAIFAVSDAILQRERQYKRIGMIALVSNVGGQLLISVPLAIAGFDYWALVTGLLATGAIEASLSNYYARVGLSLRFDRSSLDEFRDGGGLFGLTQLLSWASLSGSNIVAGYTLGATALGLYSRSWKLLDVVVSATGTPMQKVFMPVFASLRHDQDRARIEFLSAMGTLLPSFAIIGTLVALHSNFIVIVLLGKDWLQAVNVVSVLFSVLFARLSYKLCEGVIVGFGKARVSATLQTIYGLTMVTGTWAGSRYGVVGIAWGASIAILVFYCLTLFFAAQLLACGFIDILKLHMHAIIFPIAALVTHLTLERAIPSDVHVWQELLFCTTEGGVLTAIFILLPGTVIGPELARIRRKVFAKAQRLRA